MRKFFHVGAVILFIPGIVIDAEFTHLSFLVALVFYIDYIGYFITS
jgi:hypothetical protein